MSTANPTHPSDHREVIRLLNTLIEVGIDAEKGYAEASADVRDPDLKIELMEHASDRAGFVRALQKAATRLGVLPENEGTLRGAAHRGWMELRKGLEAPDDRHLLEECCRGERMAKKTYDRALTETPLDTLPTNVQHIVRGQYAEIVDSIRALEARIERRGPRPS